MKVSEILLAFLVPPLAVARRKGTSNKQVALTFVYWLLGWFPGVIYALAAEPQVLDPGTGRDVDADTGLPEPARRA